VVINEPGAVDVRQLAEIEADKVVQALMFVGSDKGFAEGVSSGRPHGLIFVPER